MKQPTIKLNENIIIDDCIVTVIMRVWKDGRYEARGITASNSIVRNGFLDDTRKMYDTTLMNAIMYETARSAADTY